MATRQKQQSAAPAALQRWGRVARRPSLGALVLLLAALALPVPAQAAPDWRRSVQEQLEPQNLTRPSISVEQCANLIRRQTGGRVLSVSPARRGDDRGCEVRVLIEGKRVKNYFVDDEGRIRSRD